MSLALRRCNLRVNGWFYLADGDSRRCIPLWRCRSGGSAARGGTADHRVLFPRCSSAMALLFYAGSYDYGADVRYSLATYPPLMACWAGSRAGMGRWLGRARAAADAGRYARRSPLLLLAVRRWYLPLVRSTTDGAWAARADVRFRHIARARPAAGCYVLTQNPGMFQVLGISAGQMSLVVGEPARLDALAQRHTGGVYVHWNFWCNVQDPVQRRFCTRLLELRSGELIREQWVGDQRFRCTAFNDRSAVVDDADAHCSPVQRCAKCSRRGEGPLHLPTANALSRLDLPLER